jgi:hypothetical protein
VTAIASAGWFVGGELKLFIENCMVVPGSKFDNTTPVRVTIPVEVDPEH